MRSPAAPDRHFARLARAYRLQSAYTDGLGQKRHASPDAVLATLRALGVEATTPREVRDSVRSRRVAVWSRALEPVVVAWQGRGDFVIRVPEAKSSARVRCHLRLEDGGTHEWTLTSADDKARRTARVEGVAYVRSRHALPIRVPHGYHRLRVDIGSQRHTAIVIAAPTRAFDDRSESWGCFLPLHALHTDRSWGIGDLSDLRSMMTWMQSRGAQVVSTLPLLACFLDDVPFEPSPYLPVSRLFWNEVFIDPRVVPEFETCAAAQRLVESTVFRREIRALQKASLVDYRRAMAAKRQVLELLSQSLARRRGPRHREIERWMRQNPLVVEYARFRATAERRGQPPSMWPADLTPDTLRETRGDRGAVRYHLYVQWIAQAQLQSVAADARSSGDGLYLDFPLGVHPEGFDVWRYPQLFAGRAATGAPPDELFVSGQNWTAPPPHPETARQDGYRYFRSGLTRQLEISGALRIDHVMALHRLYWIPDGFASTDGVYVHYPVDELYAMVCLESHRHRTRIIGENLGTVPPVVNRTMTRHGVGQLYVAQFNVNQQASRPLRRVPPRALACVNTHDTPTFKGFVDGADIDDRVSRGVIGPDAVRISRRRRGDIVRALQRLRRSDTHDGAPEVLELLQHCLATLARSQAGLVLVNLEDVWLEARPQNVPGTTWEHPNWRRKARYPLEEWASLPDLSATLRQVAQGRKAGRRRRRRSR